MVRILSLSESDELIEGLNTALEQTSYLVNYIGSERVLYEELSKKTKSVVLLPASSYYDVYNVCSYITSNYLAVKVLLVLPAPSDLDTKKALRAGAHDAIFLSSAVSKIKSDILDAIDAIEVLPLGKAANEIQKDGKVITVCSTKGGVGKTTVAVNLAASFTKSLVKVAIIDLDLQFGDVAMFFDVKPKRTFYDWIKEDTNGSLIEDYMTLDKEGVSILSAPQRPEFSEVITGNHVKKAIKELKKRFDVIIIDASSHMDENIIVALENSQEIIVVTHLDLPTLKNSKLLIDTLESLQLGDRVKVVLNKMMKVKGLTIETVQKILNRKVFSSLPSMEKIVITSINEGRPLIYSNPRVQLSKKIYKINEIIQGTNKESNSKLKKTKKVKGKMIHAGGHA